MANPAKAFTAGNFGSPYDIGLQLLDHATAAGTEGLWLPTSTAKEGSIEVSGSMSTLSISILGTNQLPEPLNQFTATVGGSATSGNVVTLDAVNSNIPGGAASVSYVVSSTDTLAAIAAALAALVNTTNGQATMASCGITAQAVSTAITLSFPSIWPAANTESYPYGTARSNATVFSGSSNGTETITIAPVTTLGSVIGGAITALGIYEVPMLPRWMRARLTTLTGSGAFIDSTFAGPA